MKTRKNSPAGRPARRPLRIEHLEDRTVPAAAVEPFLNAFLPAAVATPAPAPPAQVAPPAVATPAPAPPAAAAAPTPPAAAPSNAWTEAARPFVAGEWVVRVADVTGSPADQISLVSEQIGKTGFGLAIKSYLGLDGTFVVRGPADAAAAREAVATLGTILSLEPNYTDYRVALTPDDTDYGLLYGLHNTGQTILGTPGVIDADIDAPEAWDTATGTSAVVIAGIDTGIDYRHNDLYLNIWINEAEIPAAISAVLSDVDGDGIITFYDLNDGSNQGAGKITDLNGNGYIDGGDILDNASGWEDGADSDGNGYTDDFLGWDFVSNDNDPMDDQVGVYHGTHTAGTFGAIGDNGLGVVGVNWRARIMALKFLDSGGGGSYENSVLAVNYSVDNGAQLSNNSWGGGGADAGLDAAITNAQAAGQLFVAAAGNGSSNIDGGGFYPAGFTQDNIISVAASTNTDAWAGFSNWGLVNVDLAAPGNDTWSLQANNGYAYLSGTSMASPHVAGAALLAWSINPAAPYTDIRDALFAGVDANFAFRTDGPHPVATGGRLNLANTLSLVGLSVTSTTPAVGSTVAAPVSDFVVNFSEAVVPSTVQASDFKVNTIAASTVVLSNADKTATFSFAVSPVTTQGVQTMALAADQIESAVRPGEFNLPFAGSFRYDVLALAVTSVDPPDGSPVTTQSIDVTLTFNEPVDPTTVSEADLALSAGTVTAAAVGAGNLSATYTIELPLVEQSITVTLPAGAVTDAFTNPNPAAFSATYEFDFGTVDFPTPLTGVAPGGSLVYEGSAVGRVGVPGDEDGFLLTIDGGQQTVAWVAPAAGSALVPVLSVFDSGNNLVATVTAPGAGQPTAPTSLILAAGTYRFVVGGDAGTTGDYAIQVVLNASPEAENIGGPLNDTPATAEGLTFLPIGPGADRAAVQGGVTAAGAVTVYSEDFEGGGGGYEVNNYFGGLWHTSTRRSGDAGHSPSTSFYYGDEGSGNYDFGANAGLIASPAIALPGVGTLLLDFNYFLESEGSSFYDAAEVYVFVDGSYYFLGEMGDTGGGWQNAVLDVTGFAGQSVQVVFNFDTRDSLFNFYEGWYVDDVRVQQILPVDYYAVTLAAGETLSFGTDSPNTLVSLYDGGTLLALGAPAANLGSVIDAFVAPAAGTYYIQVTGELGSTYTLVVTRGAGFDVESNSSIADAQPLYGEVALGQLVPVSSLQNFDTIPFQFIPSSGVTIDGVTYSYDGPYAYFGGFGPGFTPLNSPPSIQGNTGGILTFEFASPSTLVQFGMGVSTTGDLLGAVVSLYDSSNALIGSFDLNMTPPAGFFFSEGLFSYSGAAVSRVVIDPNEGSGAGEFVLDNLSLAGGVDPDFYAVELAAGTTFTISTATPGDGAGEPGNVLDPLVRVYDAGGNLVAENDNGAADGRNASLNFLAAGGTYYIEVSSAAADAAATGDYVLTVADAAPPAVPFEVESSTIADGARFRPATVPADLIIDFNDTILLTSLDASDLTLDGIPAIGFEVLDGNSVKFILPDGLLTEGFHELAIAGGSILDIQGTPIGGFTSLFEIDATPPQVTGITLAPGDLVSAGFLYVEVDFSESMNTAFPYSAYLLGEFRGTFYSVDYATFVDADTLGLYFFNVPDDRYTLTLVAGFDGGFNLQDTVGNALDGNGDGAGGDDYVLDDFGADLQYDYYSQFLSPVGPAIGLTFQGAPQTSTVTFAGDADELYLYLDPSQAITATVSPQAGLSVQVELIGPDFVTVLATATSPAPGEPAVLNGKLATAGGYYGLRVTGLGADLGLYTVAVTLNAALETEAADADSNNTPATAEPVLGFTTLSAGPIGGTRATVLASLKGGTGGADGLIDDLEPNNTIGGAQSLETEGWSLGENPDITNSTTVPHITVKGTGDGTYDYYSFTVPAGGGSATFDIDQAFGAVLDSELFLFDSAGNFLAGNDDDGSDPGSSHPFNSYIAYNFGAGGTYVIGVAVFNSSGGFGGISGPAPQPGDVYDLHVSVAGHTTGAPPTPDSDVFSFTLTAGQVAAVSATATDGDPLTLEILNAGGTVLATGVATASLGSLVDAFTAAAGTYYARVSGPSGQYSLLVNLGLAQDAGGNSTQDTAQELIANGVVGNLEAASNPFFYDVDAGWYDGTGFHNPFNTNYITGALGGLEYRDFLVFDLSTVAADISAATLYMYTFQYIGDDAFETYNLYPVTTDVGALTDGSAGLAGFDDLGDGTPLATVDVTSGQSYSYITITLNADGIAYLNANKGGLVALGGALSTLAFADDEGLYGFSYSFGFQALELAYAPIQDWYEITVEPGNRAIRVQTSVPGGGFDQFYNGLDPQIELYDADGNLVASGIDLADGVNEVIDYLVPGTDLVSYYVKIVGENGSSGQYFLAACTMRSPTITVQVDDGQTGFTAGKGWNLAQDADYAYQGDYRVITQDSGFAKPGNVARWTFRSAAVNSEVFVSWVARPTNATNATYKVYDGKILRGTIVVDQTQVPSDAVAYTTDGKVVLVRSLGVFTFNSRVLVVTLDSVANGDVVADGVFDPPAGGTGSAAAATPALPVDPLSTVVGPVLTAAPKAFPTLTRVAGPVAAQLPPEAAAAARTAVAAPALPAKVAALPVAPDEFLATAKPALPATAGRADSAEADTGALWGIDLTVGV